MFYHLYDQVYNSMNYGIFFLEVAIRIISKFVAFTTAQIKRMPVVQTKNSQPAVLILFFLLFGASTSLVRAQESGTPFSFIVRQWSHEEGMVHHQVNTMIQTRDGYIWLGTPAGLIRFDGLTMTEFNTWKTPELTHNRILSLFQDRQDVLWVGIDGGGLFAYQDNSWTQYNRAEGLYNGHVRAITEDWKGRLWVGTEFGLHWFDSGIVDRFTVEHGLLDNIITALSTDSLGNIWAGTLQGGLAKCRDGIIQVYGYKEGLSNTSIMSLASDQDRVWIGTMQGLYYIRYGEEIVRQVENTAYTPITSIMVTPSDKVWIGTMVDGLKLLEGGALKNVPVPPDYFIRTLLIDSDSGLWAGTDQAGLVQLAELPISIIPHTRTLKPHTVLKDSRGFLWVGTEAEGVVRIKAGFPIKSYDLSNGLAGNQVRALMEDHSGRIWIGDQKNGVSIIESGRVVVVNDLQGTGVTAFLNGPDATVWIGTEKGLFSFRNSRLSAHAWLSGQHVRSLYQDGTTLYAGTRSSVFRKIGDRFEKLQLRRDETAFDVLSICSSADNILWFGTNGSGLAGWNGDSLRIYTIRDGLPDNFILSIIPDQTGRFWITCMKGLFSVHPDSLIRYSSGHPLSLIPTLFTSSDGLGPAVVRSSGNPVAVFADPELMVATSAGIALLNPSEVLKRGSKPSVRIELITADGKPVQLSEPIVLPSSTRQLEFTFTGFDFQYPDRLHFQYRLEGYEKAGHMLHPGQPRKAEYRNVSAGEYQFHLRAVNNNGMPGELASLSFRISKPIFQQPFFYILFLCLALAGWIFWYVLKKQKTLQKKQAKYRTTPVDPQWVIKIQSKLAGLMEEEAVYLNPDLTLKDLARMLKIHPNYLSRIINEQFEMSYNDYVNEQRIRKVQMRLKDPAEKDKSILDIMYTTGFYSKSVFNTAFKKFTQTTPSAYRKAQSR